MESTSMISVILGSAVLLGLAILVAVDGIRTRSVKGRKIVALDDRWKKVKVEVPSK